MDRDRLAHEEAVPAALEYEQAGKMASITFTCCAGVTEFNPEDIVKRADRARTDAARGGISHVVARKRGRFGFLNLAS
jgi:hypothetical protein